MRIFVHPSSIIPDDQVTYIMPVLLLLLALLSFRDVFAFTPKGSSHRRNFDLAAKRRTKAVVRKRDLSDDFSDAQKPVLDSPSRAAEVSRQNRIKELSETSSLSDQALEELLKKDISDFNALSTKAEDKSENQLLATLKNAFAVFLIADFFVVLAFLAWFLAGVALQSTNAVVLERFQDIFQPVVVPSLTVLMVGSFLSGDFGKEKNK